MTKKKNSMYPDIMGLTKGSLMLGIGSDVVTKAGGSASGLAAFSGYLRPMGSLVGLKHTMKHMKKVKY